MRSGLGATDEDRARCSVDLDRVTRDVRDLIFHQQLQNEHSDFVLKSIAQSLNSCALDDVLKLPADASVGAVNLLADPGGYLFGSLDVRVEPLDYDCLGHSLGISQQSIGYGSESKTDSGDPAALRYSDYACAIHSGSG
jgi:hypothetical protein